MKMFTGQIELKGKYKLEVYNDVVYVLKNDNMIYYEDSDKYWEKREFNKQGNMTYYEDSNGLIEDKRNKKIK